MGKWDLLKNCSVDRSGHAAYFCNLNLTSISYSFWNKGRKSINILKIWWKKGNNSKMGNQIYLKIAGVDLDMLNMFAVKLNLYLL